MKSILTLFCALSLIPFANAQADFLLKPNDVLAICGDSITEQEIYSVFMEDYLLMCQPVDGLRVAQFGWGGEKASGFLARLDSDVLPFKPTVVTTCYGMNDGAYILMTPGTGTAYRQAMTASIEKLKASGVRALVVGSPGCVDGAVFHNPQTTAEIYNHTLDALRGIAGEVAGKEGVEFADVHTPMMDVMTKSKAAYGDSYAFVAGGGVHPGPNGHLVMAYAFLKALGCDGAIATITVDLGANQATGTPGQTVVSCANGTVAIKSTRYPFCFQGDPDKGEQTSASVLKFFPFNNDLNRYVLVVKGLKGTKAKVTWGKESKEFTAADLEKGVNLAAEFISNPFSDQFDKVNTAVQAQQTFEKTLVKQYLHSLAAFKTMVPSEVDSLDRVAAGGLKQDEVLFHAAHDLVIPIQHTIQIESER